MYAIMNTCQELQRAGIDPGTLETACTAGESAVQMLQAAYVSTMLPAGCSSRIFRASAAAAGDEKKVSSVAEYIDIYRDLRSRYLTMIEVMIPVVRTIPDIRKEAGQLNLRYERQEPDAINTFRKVCAISR